MSGPWHEKPPSREADGWRAGVAIVGMDVLLPGAPGLAAYWRNLRDGVDAITDLPEGRWDERFYAPDGDRTGEPERVYCRRGGFVDELADVEVTRFGIMPRSVAGAEPDQLIALHVAANAIADAGGENWLPADRDRVGVVLGRGGYLTPGVARLDQRLRTAHQLVQTLGELLPGLDASTVEQVRHAFTDQLGPHEPESAIGLVPNLAASRLANRLDLRGPAYTVDAACASSLVAVDNALMELNSGRCDVVLAGGVHHCHDITLWSVFAQLGALSPTQRISPLDRAADGILIGEGTGVVVLKRLADAERDGDRIYAVIRGSGVSSDGRSASLMNPDPGGQVRAVGQAWRMAGLDPRAPGSLGLLEAHGTATPAGDEAELSTVAEVFGEDGASGRAQPRIPIGSVKSMIGHAMPAAGVASLVKAALAVHHATLPPTLNCADPHPALRRSRFAPIEKAHDWECHPEQPLRRAGISAFGFGGINAHLLIEQAPGATAVAPPHRVSTVDEPERVLRLSAGTVAELADLLDNDVTGLTDTPDQHGPVRLGIVAPTPKRLALAKKAVAKGVPWRGRSDVWFTPNPLFGAGGKLAFVFPGLEAEFEPSTDDIAELFGLRNPSTSDDSSVGDVGRHGADVVALGRLLHSALHRMNVAPDAVAGHSVGEWTAMACAGFVAPADVDDFLDRFDPDILRVPGLTFAVLGAGADTVADTVAEAPGVVLSHDNAPNQAMVCGPEDAVRELVERFRGRGVLGQVLPFQSGFHTPMLEPYLDGIRAAIDTYRLSAPTVPMYSATTTGRYPSDPDAVRALFSRHLLEPVRFRPMIEAMYADGYTGFVQLGVGQLGSLIGDTLRGRDHLVVAAASGKHGGLAQLRRVATALWVEALEVGGEAPLLPEDTVPATAPRHASRLDLSGGLVSLPAGKRPVLLGHAPPTTPLDELAMGSTLAAELAASLKDTADSAVAVLTAAGPPAVTGAVADEPAPTGPTDELRGVLPVSVESMPHLLDHCFFAQRDGWPDVADRHPVVPGTTLIAQLAEVGESLRPGLRAVEVRDVALTRWLVAGTPIEVPILATATAPDTVRAEVTGYASATVELAEQYPAPPAPWRFDPASERTPELAAEQLYTERWMFHGPRYQGVTELTAIGEHHVRGTLRTPEGPGGLLDNVGQLLGYWIMATVTHRNVVFPIGMRRIRFHGPHPELGAELECLIRITALEDNDLHADMQLVRDGVVWAEITGWVDRRFDSDPMTVPVDRDVANNALSQPQPGDWELVYERWSNLAWRDLMLRNQTSSIERADYDARPPTARRQWMLGRIALKDAVRRHLWRRGAGAVFPAEIAVSNDADGAPLVTGLHGRTLPELVVSVAHCREAGVAVVRPAEDCAGVGIDVEEITAPSDGAMLMALSDGERAMLERMPGDAAVWFTRFWVAKEAAAKASGTGLGHRPRAFTVCATDEDPAGGHTVRVLAPDGAYSVHTNTVSNPDGFPRRDYVVGWTVRNTTGESGR